MNRWCERLTNGNTKWKPVYLNSVWETNEAFTRAYNTREKKKKNKGGGRKYTHLYENGIKKTRIKSIKTTRCSGLYPNYPYHGVFSEVTYAKNLLYSTWIRVVHSGHLTLSLVPGNNQIRFQNLLYTSQKISRIKIQWGAWIPNASGIQMVGICFVFE